MAPFTHPYLISDFHFPPELEWDTSEEGMQKKWDWIRKLWYNCVRDHWYQIDSERVVKNRLQLDSELFAFAQRGFQTPVPVTPRVEQHVWFDLWKVPNEGWIEGFRVDDDAFLVVRGHDSHGVKANKMFSSREDCLIDSLQEHALLLVGTAPLRDSTRMDPYTEQEMWDLFESKRPARRRAIRFILSQLEKLMPLIPPAEEDLSDGTQA